MTNYTVIPTRFDRPTLLPLVEAASAVSQVVIVHTEPGHAPIRGTITVRDYSLSIQHWWNSGLDQCDGPALVLNDDVIATPHALTVLFAELELADLVWLAGHRIGHATPLTGWCFGLHPDRIRPSNDFGWWYGDDDLYQRAVRDGLTISAVEVRTIKHQRAEVAFVNPKHAEMVDQDARLYHERWG